MITRVDDIFYLETDNTCWMFRILPSGHPEHLHYGRKLAEKPDKKLIGMIADGLSDKQLYPGGNMVQYSKDAGALCLENTCLEFSSMGKGDIGDPFIEIKYSDGGTTSDFIFEEALIRSGKREPRGMPGAYAREDEGVMELTVRYRERVTRLLLETVYAVFPSSDVITRRARISVPEDAKLPMVNGKRRHVRVRRLMSGQLDVRRTGLVMTSFHGHWADEMHRTDTQVKAGKAVSDEAWAGVSGSRSNPFVMLSTPETTEAYGECIGANLIYSGNHYEALSADGFDRSRFLIGMHPAGFSWKLKPGEKLDSPEAVFCYSDRGFGGMSRRMHAFVRNNIVRGEWKDRPRPVLLNSWEANYFKFNESRLLKQAKAAKDLGIELFVMDDGWFGARDDDTSSLGDWTVNRNKLPGGLGGLADRLHAMGLKFGIWVEPEMISEKSELYAKHPEWAVRYSYRDHSEGRNQMILDLTREEVQDHLIREMKRVFSEAKADYVKWDMNRIFSDRYSLSLGPDRQGEFAHRYVLGLYRVLKELTGSFPGILFEGCAAGGNRFDLGMLSFFPQIWASDDTDAVCRADIQRGYSYGYPMSVIAAHVSASPNHQTLNPSPLSTRFAVAAFGCLGYECDPCDIQKDERGRMERDIAWYKKWRDMFFFGTSYRLENGAFMVVSPDRKRAAALILQRENRPNRPYMELKLRGLKKDAVYHVTNRKTPVTVRDFGSQVNMMSPVHVKEGGMVQDILSKAYKLPSEKEDQYLTGAALCACGVRLLPNYAGTGFGEGVRVFRTGDARLILLEETDPDQEEA